MITSFSAHNKTILRALFVILYVAIFGQCLFFDYLFWDDKQYILENPYLQEVSLASLRGILIPGNIPHETLYIPVTYLSYLPNGGLLNFNPMIAHGINIIIHAANVYLVFHVGVRIFNKKGLAYLACAIFCFHPIQVEAVAWVFGRKELLACFGVLMSLNAYIDYLDTKSKKYFLFSLAWFIFSLLSKPSGLLLPISFLILTILRNDTNWKRSLSYILPFLMSSGMAFVCSRANVAVGSSVERFSIWNQLVYLPYAVSEWLLRLFNVVDCSTFYLWTELSPDVIAIYSFILPAIILVGVYYCIHQKAWRVLFALSITVLWLLPALGLFLLRSRVFYTADRYTYVGLVGLSFGIMALRRSSFGFRISQRVAYGVISIYLVTCMIKTFTRVKVWKSPVELGIAALSENPDNPLALNTIGACFLKKEAFKHAETYFWQATQKNLRQKVSWQSLYLIAELQQSPNMGKIYRHMKLAERPREYSTFLAADRLNNKGKVSEAFSLIKSRFPDDSSISLPELLELNRKLKTLIQEK